MLLLKQSILGKETLVMPGAFDALSARIVEQTGFKRTTLGGYPASANMVEGGSDAHRDGKRTRGDRLCRGDFFPLRALRNGMGGPLGDGELSAGGTSEN